MSLKPEDHSIAWDRFTNAQRRRAEALLLVRLLFPASLTGTSQIGLARWVTTGRTEPRPGSESQ